MGDESQVISCGNLDIWREHFSKAKDAKKLVVVDFMATWCPPCRVMAPIFAGLAKKHPEVLFLKVDVDELKIVAEEWGVEAMPTFMLFVEGKLVDKVVGSSKDELEKKVEQHAAAAASAST